MFAESCSHTSCYRYTCYHCSACHRPYCTSHLHQRAIIAYAHQIILCDACLQQPDSTRAETLASQDRRLGWASPHRRPNSTIRLTRKLAKEYV